MSVYLADADFTLHQGDVLACLADLPDESVHCVVTSPPYWGLRDYGADGQIGLEATPEEYVERMVAVFGEVRRVLRADGTLWLNLGDSYNTLGPKGPEGHDKSTLAGGGPAYQRDVSRSSPPVRSLKTKDMVGIPWRVALALQADGWYLRADVIWSKPNPMPESVTDRPTKAHEYLFLLAKSRTYYYDQDAIREGYRYDGRRVMEREAGEMSHENHRNGKRNRWPGLSAAAAAAARRDLIDVGHVESEPMEINHAGRNARSVWEIATQPYPEAHFATFPQELARRCILAGTPEGGTVLDPFLGSGTTAYVARAHGRHSIGIELNPDYCALAAKRMQQQSLLQEATNA